MTSIADLHEDHILETSESNEVFALWTRDPGFSYLSFLSAQNFFLGAILPSFPPQSFRDVFARYSRFSKSPFDLFPEGIPGPRGLKSFDDLRLPTINFVTITPATAGVLDNSMAAADSYVSSADCDVFFKRTPRRSGGSRLPVLLVVLLECPRTTSCR